MPVTRQATVVSRRVAFMARQDPLGFAYAFDMMTIHDLVAATAIPERTIRSYQQQGLLPPFNAEDGGYTEAHVHTLAAIKWLRANGFKTLDAIKARLAELSPEQLGDFEFGPEKGEEEDTQEESLADEDAPTYAETARAAGVPLPPMPTAPTAANKDLWRRVVVRPGLELLVQQGADEELQRIAAEIQAKYAVPPH